MLNRYEIPLPDGKVAIKTTPDYVVHTWAVIGLLKLKMLLPPLNPDDKDEEPRYRRYQRWVLLATSERESNAKRMAAEPVYPEATLETRVIPIVGVPTAGQQSEGLAAYQAAQRGPFVAPTAPPAFKPRMFDVKDIEVTSDKDTRTVITRVTVEIPPVSGEIALDPELVAKLTRRSGLVDSLKQIPLEDSNYILPEIRPDGSTKLVELQGVTFKSMTCTPIEPELDDLEPCDFGDL